MTNIFPEHKFDKTEINDLASLMSSSMLIIPGALVGFVFGTIAILPMSAVTGLTVLGGIFSYLSSHNFIHNEAPNEDSLEKKNEKEALIAIATSFSVFIGAILGISFGVIFLFKFMPGIWPNLEAFIGLVFGIVSAPFVLNYFISPEDITANDCVKLSVAFEIMLYTGLVSFCFLESFPGWLSFGGWGAGLGFGLLGGLAIGSLISNSMSEGNKDMFAKQSLLNVSLPSIIIGLASGFAANLLFEISSIYFTLGVGFSVTSLLMIGTYQIVKYFGDCNDPYSKEIVHNILILTATFFPCTFAGSLLSAGIYSFLHVYTDGLLAAVAEGYLFGASASLVYFGISMYRSLTNDFIEEKENSTNRSDNEVNQLNVNNKESEENNIDLGLDTLFYYDETVGSASTSNSQESSSEDNSFSRFLGTGFIVSSVVGAFTVFAANASAYFYPENNFTNSTYQL